MKMLQRVKKKEMVHFNYSIKRMCVYCTLMHTMYGQPFTVFLHLYIFI
jgi:uncharacterized membrane protein